MLVTDLKDREEQLRSSMSQRRSEVLKDKKLALFERLISESNHQDVNLIEDLTRGFDLTGELRKSGVFDGHLRPAKVSCDNLRTYAKVSRDSVLKTVGSSGEDELDRGLWEATLKEVGKGFLEGPVEPESMPPDSLLTKRFPVRQTNKIRPIDDYKGEPIGLVHCAVPSLLVGRPPRAETSGFENCKATLQNLLMDRVAALENQVFILQGEVLALRVQLEQIQHFLGLDRGDPSVSRSRDSALDSASVDSYELLSRRADSRSPSRGYSPSPFYAPRSLEDETTHVPASSGSGQAASQSVPEAALGAPVASQSVRVAAQSVPVAPTQTGTVRTSPSRSSPTPSRVGSDTPCSLTWLQRENIAEEIGGFLARAIAGQHRGSSGRERIPLSSKLWIIVRDFQGQIYTPVKVVRTWASCRALVEGPHRALGDSVYVQRMKVTDVTASKLLSRIFKAVTQDEALFRASPYQYRKRWDLLLKTLGVPKHANLTPGGLRGGAAIWHYKAGKHIADLLWLMRLRSQATLEHYLQEVAALNAFASFSDRAKDAISSAASIFPFLLRSAGRMQGQDQT
eukprot:Skav232168  [mRNA]  locus=scaffold1040:629053:640165:- [translate_table: standard]